MFCCPYFCPKPMAFHPYPAAGLSRLNSRLGGTSIEYRFLCQPGFSLQSMFPVCRSLQIAYRSLQALLVRKTVSAAGAFIVRAADTFSLHFSLAAAQPTLYACSFALLRTSSLSFARKSASGMTSCLPLRLRTATVPASCSLSPRMSIYGIFSICASRIL